MFEAGSFLVLTGKEPDDAPFCLLPDLNISENEALDILKYAPHDGCIDTSSGHHVINGMYTLKRLLIHSCCCQK